MYKVNYTGCIARREIWFNIEKRTFTGAVLHFYLFLFESGTTHLESLELRKEGSDSPLVWVDGDDVVWAKGSEELLSRNPSREELWDALYEHEELEGVQLRKMDFGVYEEHPREVSYDEVELYDSYDFIINEEDTGNTISVYLYKPKGSHSFTLYASLCPPKDSIFYEGEKQVDVLGVYV